MNSDVKESYSLIDEDEDEQETLKSSNNNEQVASQRDIVVNRSHFGICCECVTNFLNNWCPMIFAVAFIIIIVSLIARITAEYYG